MSCLVCLNYSAEHEDWFESLILKSKLKLHIDKSYVTVVLFISHIPLHTNDLYGSWKSLLLALYDIFNSAYYGARLNEWSWRMMNLKLFQLASRYEIQTLRLACTQQLNCHITSYYLVTLLRVNNKLVYVLASYLSI